MEEMPRRNMHPKGPGPDGHEVQGHARIQQKEEDTTRMHSKAHSKLTSRAKIIKPLTS